MSARLVQQVGRAVVLVLALASCSSPPPAPSGVMAEVISSTEILLKWSLVGPDTKYEISRKEGDGSYVVLGMMEPPATSLIHSGLKKGTPYHFRVRACNRAGCSPYSAELSATTHSG